MLRTSFLCTALVGSLLSGVSAAETPKSLQVIPQDGFAFVTVRVDQLIEHPVVKPFVEGLQALPNSPIKEMERETGFKLTELERVTVMFPNASDEMEFGVFIVTMRRPIDKKQLLTAMEALSPKQFGGRPRWVPARAEKWDEGTAESPKEEVLPFPEEKGEAPFPEKGEEAFPEKFDEKKDCSQEVFEKIESEHGEETRFEPDLGAPYYHPGHGDDMVMMFLDERTLLFLPSPDSGEPADFLTLVSQLIRRTEQGGLTDALSVAGDHLVVAGISVSQVNQFLPEPAPLEMLAIKPLLNAESATLTLDLDEKLKLAATLRFANADAAKDGQNVLRFLQTLARSQFGQLRKDLMKMPEDEGRDTFAKLLTRVELAVNEATIQTEGTNVQVALSVPADEAFAAAIQAAILKVDQAQARMKGSNNLKQIAVAMHNYEATHARFPGSASYSREGKPLLSWRVAILPYVEQNALYNQFRHDEPWDSEHNLKLLEQMPPIFSVPGRKTEKPGMTYIQGFVGEHGFFPDPRPGDRRFPFPGGPTGRRISSIHDGTSHTIMVTEAAEAVPWTKPADIPFDGKNVPKLGAPNSQGFNAAYCDGSVRFIRSTIDPVMLRRFIDPQDGEVIDYEQFEK